MPIADKKKRMTMNHVDHACDFFFQFFFTNISLDQYDWIKKNPIMNILKV